MSKKLGLALATLAVAPVLLGGDQSAQATVTTNCSRASIEAIASQAVTRATQGRNEPGVSVAVYAPLSWANPVAAAHGWADFSAEKALTKDAPMLAGSIGKTIYAAAALRLVDSNRLDLDAPIARYLAGFNVPAADTVTVRMLMSHTSGYGEYDGDFMTALIKEPLRVHTLNDWVGPLRRTPPGPTGVFRYSDINFVLLAHVIDNVVDGSANDFIEAEFLRPYGLNHTKPSDRVDIAGLTPGYAGPNNFFGRDAMVVEGRLIYNPQFESGGGGYLSTASDLARWMALFSVGNFFSQERWREASTVTHRDPVTGKSYGLGVHIDPTPLGTAYGHSGYIPGYYSWVRWYPSVNVAVAIQTNSSDDSRVPWDGYDLLDSIARDVSKACN